MHYQTSKYIIMAQLIKTDGTSETLDDLSLESMQNAVGGYIELVQSSEYDFICDEEGKLKGYSINAKATHLAHKANALPINDVLVGNVIIAKKGEIQ